MTAASSSEVADAVLVAAIRGGDPASWGTIFDRHRDAVWRLAFGIVRRRADADDVVQATFLKAVESIDQLRDPAALRPWLLSISRRRALDMVRRVREVAHDPGDGEWIEQMHSLPGDSLVDGLHQEELARLVAAAFDGLDPRDRAALELAERQELSGDELALSLDVTRDNAYQMLHNARDRFEASVTSLIVARNGRADCDDLDSLLEGWDGNLTPLLRKRLARHMKRCGTCNETRRLQVTPAALLALLPVVGMATLAADQGRASALTAASAGTATSSGAASIASLSSAVGAKAAAAVVVTALLGGGVFVAVSNGDGGDTGIAIVELAPQDGGDQPADPIEADSVTSVPATATPTTAPPTTATEEFCDIVAELSEAGAGGPASADPKDLAVYLVMVSDYMQRLVVASTPTTPELTEYAAAFAEVAAAGPEAAQQWENDSELNVLGDIVKEQFSDTCSDTTG
ncbi:MAG: sigma-70 family RNA polymerase sigma factor [Acidimicrobiales bacterium]|nr:sigma-70 family RNA polymerase sigma factor [Acidimicrobiales bacterium]